MKRLAFLILLTSLATQAAAQFSCADVKYGSPNYHENMKSWFGWRAYRAITSPGTTSRQSPKPVPATTPP